MWHILNTTDFRCAGTFQRDADGFEFWCTAIRATFTVLPDGGLRLAEDQDDVALVPRFGGKNDEVLLADDDIIPFAPLTDILIRGVANPVEGRSDPVAMVAAIGAVRKEVILFPPRRAHLTRGGWRVQVAPRQTAASLGWEACFGGTLPDQPPDNPMGTGIALRVPRLFDSGTEIDLPRIEGMGLNCARDPHRSRSVGFGPIPRWWRERIRLAGRFDEDWRRHRAPTMPVDYDPRFSCSAPADQWPAKHLIGGEQVHLQGFTGGRDWQFRLPQAVFRVETRFGRTVKPVPVHLARIDLWPSDNRVSLLWVGALGCNGQDHLIGTTRVSLRQLAGVRG